MDLATTVLEGHEQEVDNIQDVLDQLQDKMEDAENRVWRDNLHLHGLPEVITDLQVTATAFFQELTPDIPLERLERNRIHRALSAKQPDDPSRDVISKFHYFHTKKKLLQSAHEQQVLFFQGNSLQLFADISLQDHYCQAGVFKTLPANPTNPWHKVQMGSSF